MPDFKDLVLFLMCHLKFFELPLWLILIILLLASTGLGMPSSKVHDRIILHLSLGEGLALRKDGLACKIETIKWTVLLAMLQPCRSPSILGSNIKIRGVREGILVFD